MLKKVSSFKKLKTLQNKNQVSKKQGIFSRKYPLTFNSLRRDQPPAKAITDPASVGVRGQKITGIPLLAKNIQTLNIIYCQLTPMLACGLKN